MCASDFIFSEFVTFCHATIPLLGRNSSSGNLIIPELYIKQKAMENLIIEPIEPEEMKTLVSCINHLIRDGFTEDYKVVANGLKALGSGNVYRPEEVRVANFYRFEGSSDPGDESILYAIETDDGGKGTLVDAYGPFSDTMVTSFMHKVQDISKKTGKTVIGQN